MEKGVRDVRGWLGDAQELCSPRLSLSYAEAFKLYHRMISLLFYLDFLFCVLVSL